MPNCKWCGLPLELCQHEEQKRRDAEEASIAGSSSPCSAWVGDDDALRTETECAYKEWQADGKKVWEHFNGQLDEEDHWKAGYVAGRLAQSAKSPTDSSSETAL